MENPTENVKKISRIFLISNICIIFAPLIIKKSIMILGYAISDTSIRDKRKFIKYVSSMEDADLSLPCIVVGYAKAKALDGFNVLEKKLSDTLFWTLGRTEKRTDHERDLASFYKYVFEYNARFIRYYYVNIFKLKYGKTKNFINILTKAPQKTIYINNDMLYIYCSGSDYVLGFSERMLRFVHIDTGRHLNKLLSLGGCTVCDLDDPEVKTMSGDVGDKEYAIPYLIDKIR